LAIKNPTHLLFRLQINLEIIFTLKTRNFLFNKVQITIHIITISIVLEIPFMAELVPMSKPIILLAFRLPKIIPNDLRCHAQNHISHNIIFISKSSQVIVCMSFRSLVMVTPLINFVLLSIIIVILPLYPIQSILNITNHQVKPLQHLCYILNLKFYVVILCRRWCISIFFKHFESTKRFLVEKISLCLLRFTQIIG